MIDESATVLPARATSATSVATRSWLRPFKELNFSVFKDTAITERVNMQLRAEFFNILNHPNFANPNLPNFITDAATNGLDANGRGVGFLPLTATGDVGIGNPFLGGGGPRGLQFAVKFTF